MDKDLHAIIVYVRDLEASRDHYAGECQSLIEIITKLEKEIEDRNNTLRTDKETIEEQQTIIERLNAKIRILNRSIHMQRMDKDTIKDQETTIGRFNSEMRMLKSTIHTQRMDKDTIEVLEATIDRLKAEIRVLKNTIHTHRTDKDTIEEQQATIDRLTAEVRIFNSTIQDKDLELANFVNIKREMEKVRRENERKLGDIHFLKEQTLELKETKLKLEEKIRKQRDTMRLKENQTKQLQKRIEEMSKNVAQVTKEKVCAVKEIQKYKLKLDTALTELKNVNEELLNNSAAREALEDLFKEYRAEIKQLKNELSRERCDSKSLTTRIEELEEELTRRSQELEQLRREVVTLQESLNNSQRDIEKREEDLKKKTDDLENYRTTISMVTLKVLSTKFLHSSNSVHKPRQRENSVRKRKLRKRRYKRPMVLKNQLRILQSLCNEDKGRKVGNKGDGSFMSYPVLCQPLNKTTEKLENDHQDSKRRQSI